MTSEPRLEFSALAKNDLDETWSYIAGNSVRFADKVMDDLHRTFELVAKSPFLCRSRDDLFVGMRMHPHGRYNIFYFQVENGVEIYRVLHGSRDNVQVFEDVIDSAPRDRIGE